MVYLPTFTYIYHKNQPNVGKYTIDGWYGFELMVVKQKVKLYIIIYPIPLPQLPKKSTIQIDVFSESVTFCEGSQFMYGATVFNNSLFVENKPFVIGFGFDHFLHYYSKGGFIICT